MKEELVEVFNKKIYVDVSEWRGNRVKELKGTQREKIDELKKIVIEENIDMFLDIGTNYGEFAISLVDLNIPIICFEPNPICVEMLNKTFKNMNDVNIINGAAGLSDGVKSFFYSKNYSGGGSFGKEVIQSCKDSKGDVSEISTQVYRIDNFINNNYHPLPKNILLKIDVEGFEDEVLEGCKNLLNKCKWKALVEINPQAIKKAKKKWGEGDILNNFNAKKYKDFGSDIIIGN